MGIRAESAGCGAAGAVAGAGWAEGAGAAVPTLNLVGCGRAAATLARLWHLAGRMRIGEILTRSPDSAMAACDFVGAGRPATALADMEPAGLWLVGVPDSDIGPVGAALAAEGRLRPGDGVFHLSGFTPSSVFAALAAQGARCASLHPVLSFADRQHAVGQFAGTLCGIEGDAALCQALTAHVAAIGGEGFALDPARKPLYHAGSVFAANFLVVVIDLARRAYEQGGVPPEVVPRLLAPLARKALDNVLANGGEAAITGPAARGDRAVVEAQQAAVAAWSPLAGEAYAALSEGAASLARHC